MPRGRRRSGALRAQVCDEPRVVVVAASTRTRRSSVRPCSSRRVGLDRRDGQSRRPAAWPELARRPRLHEREAPMSERLIESVSAPTARRPSPRSRPATLGTSSSAAGLALGADGGAHAAAAATDAPSADGGRRRARRTTFVLGIKQDIDSLNPFVGVVASAYEAYQLMYDTLTVRAPARLLAAAGLAERVGELGRTARPGPTTSAQGVKWSDGQPLTANDVAYTFNRVDQRRDRERPVRQLRHARSRRSPRPTTTPSSWRPREPSPSMLRLAVPILPEHIWKDIDGDAVATFANDKTPVGSGPFPLDRGADRRSSTGSPPTSPTGPARRRSTSSCCGSSPTTRRMVQALKQGRDRHRPRTSRRRTSTP